jgi:methionyl-tRNA formyltransferase
LAPYPAAWCLLNNKILKIYAAQIDTEFQEATIPGASRTILPDKLLIAAADRWIKIEELQLEGKKRLKCKEFLSGYREPIHVS